MGRRKNRNLFQYNLFENVSLSNRPLVEPVMNFILSGMNLDFYARRMQIFRSQLEEKRKGPYWRSWVLLDKFGDQKGNLYSFENEVGDSDKFKRAIRKSIRVGSEEIVQIKEGKLSLVNLEKVLYQESSRIKFNKFLDDLNSEEMKTLNRHIGQKYDRSRLEQGYLIGTPIMKWRIRQFEKCKEESKKGKKYGFKVEIPSKIVSQDEEPFELVPYPGIRDFF